MSFSAHAVAEIAPSRAFVLSLIGIDYLGAKPLAIVACLLHDRGSLSVSRRSLMPFGSHACNAEGECIKHQFLLSPQTLRTIQSTKAVNAVV